MSSRLTTVTTIDILASMKDAVRLLRIALWIRLTPMLLGTVLAGLIFSGQAAALIVLSTLPTSLVCLFISVPFVEHRLGRFFLPIGIVATIAAQAIETGSSAFLSPVVLTSLGVVSPDRTRFIEPLFLLSVTTVLSAWVYGRRGAWLTAALAGVLQLIITLISTALGLTSIFVFATLVLQVSLMVLIGTLVGVLSERQRKQTDALSVANAQLREQAAAMEQLAVARERNRLARDLHDTLAHSLAGLVVQLEAIDTLLPNEIDVARSELAAARQLAQAGLHEARHAIRDLRANPVEDLGLARALERLALDFGERAGVHIDLHVSDPKVSIANDIAETILRIAHEALNNIEQHAEAKRVEVALAQNGIGLELDIHDDGRGFDEQRIAADRYGLTGMQERAELIGAALSVDGSTGSGTTVRLVLDLDTNKR